MGIPTYFSYIIQHYPQIVQGKLTETTEHFFLDCNSIIYDIYNAIKTTHDNNVNIEKTLIVLTIAKIKEYIALIRPTKTVMIAFDGVAPFAKMKQQKTRRYKSYFISANTPSSGCVWGVGDIGANSTTACFSTTAITPGTPFMDALAEAIRVSFPEYYPKNPNLRVIVSTSQEAGEGEHKIFQYIRYNRTRFLENDNIVVYGLDSDLIMLSLFHFNQYKCKNIYTFREKMLEHKHNNNIKKHNNNNARTQQIEYTFLNIGMLSATIMKEMNFGGGIGAIEANGRTVIYDYLFLCFFLGNDFLPHFPALNIRTEGMKRLMATYREHIGKHPDRCLVDINIQIQWKWVLLLVKELSKMEKTWILCEYETRNKKWDNISATDNNNIMTEEILNDIPIFFRQQEKYINPQEAGWKERYYYTLFHNIIASTPTTPTITPTTTPSSSPTAKGGGKVGMTVSEMYYKSLEWVLLYYTTDCPDWEWSYPYDYPPLLEDLSYTYTPLMRGIPWKWTFGICPYHPYIQLSYVLPQQQLQDYLPEWVVALFFGDYYTDNDVPPPKHEFQWAFCRYFWESHVVFNDSNIGIHTMNKWRGLLLENNIE